MSANHTHPLLYRINVAEAKLGVSRSTIYRLIDAGTLQRVKIGKRACGVTAASVHAMIAGAVPTTTDVGSQAGSQVARVASMTLASR